MPKYKPEPERLPPSKKKIGSKKFVIDCRYPKMFLSSLKRYFDWQDWHIWKKYATAKQRDEALKTLLKTHKHYDYVEFRKGKDLL